MTAPRHNARATHRSTGRTVSSGAVRKVSATRAAAAAAAAPEPEQLEAIAGGGPGSRAAAAAVRGTPAVSPGYIRELCRLGLEAALPGVVALARDEAARPEDRMRAVEMLARVGVGYRTDTTEGDERPLPGVVVLPTLQRPDGTLALRDVSSPNPARLQP